MKNEVRKGLLTLAILSASLMAQEGNVSFSHRNWEMVCDNTLTYRVTGRSLEEEKGGSALLTCRTGAGTSISREVILVEFQPDGASQPSKLTLLTNDQLVGGVKSGKEGSWRLSVKQAQNIIAVVKDSERVEFKDGPDSLVLSGEGAYAVLLKMDDVQGRIEAPGALTERGDKPESSARATIPTPVIYQVKPEKTQEKSLTVSKLAVLRPKPLAILSEDDWYDHTQPSEEQEVETASLTPLDNMHSLISVLCWRVTYNERYGYWVVDSRLAGKPELIAVSGSNYGDGVTFMGQKSRGLGDCWGSANWVWDGGTFRKSREATIRIRRYLHFGGTWDFPTRVTNVKPAG